MFKRLVIYPAGNDGLERLFMQREYSALARQSGTGTWTLSAIFFLTLLALAFAMGSRQKLEQRMNDPFTNWVNLPLGPAVTDAQLQDIRQSLDRPFFRDSFKLVGTEPYVVWQELFLEYETAQLFYRKGRSIEAGSDLLLKILDPATGNLVASHSNDPVADFDNCGIIITRKALESLGYAPAARQLKVPLQIDNNTVWLAIVAVVEALPDLCDFAASPVLFRMLTEPFDQTGFLKLGSAVNVWSIRSDNGNPEEVENLVRQGWPALPLNHVQQSAFNIQANRPGFQYDLILSEFHVPDTLLYKWQQGGGDLKGHFLPITPVYCNDQFYDLPSPYYYAFQFEELNRVRDFKNWLLQRYGIEISMDQIESKENFAIVARLTLVISMVLFVFSIVSIVLFVSSLLRTHLEKIKPDLGTCKAFGLSDYFLKKAYTRIIAVFLFRAVIHAGLGCLLVGIADAVCKPAYPHFLFFHWVIPGAIVFAALACLILSGAAVERLLSDTPGNLIYGR